MKFLILIAFLVAPFICNANYMTQLNLEACDGSRPVYSKKALCQKVSGSKCYKLPKGYDCKYSRKKASKNQIEACIDTDDCQLKLKTKICLDPLEKPIKVLTEPKEVYCTREFVADKADLKAIDDTNKAAIKAAKDLNKASLDALKIKLNTGVDLSKEELRQLLLSLL